MILLFVVLIFIILLLLILLFPIETIILIANNDIEIKLILLKVIKINIKEKTTVEKMKKNKHLKRKIPLRVMFEILKELMPYIKRAVSKLSLKLEISAVYGLSSADRTAIFSGLLNMIIYNMASVLDLVLKRYRGSYNIVPDFVNERFDYKIKAGISVRMPSLIVFLIRSIKILFKYKKYLLRKGGAHNARTSNRRFNENYNG